MMFAWMPGQAQMQTRVEAAPGEKEEGVKRRRMEMRMRMGNERRW
jgi:hypothetical protein